MRRIHKKKDGYLLIEVDGQAKFLTFWESINWVFFGKLPAAPVGEL